MNYKKLMAKTFARSADNGPQLAFALIAGLAAGAAMAVLFAPKRGKDVRKVITDSAVRLGVAAKDICTSLRSKINDENVENTGNGAAQDQANEYVNHGVVKKPKSDIKDLIHEAHANGTHTEQSL